MKGRHCHKQAFEALLRYRMKGVLNKGEFSPRFKREIVSLRLVQSTANLKSTTNSPEFKQMMNNLTDAFGTHAQMMMQYIRDVSAMLYFVSADLLVDGFGGSVSGKPYSTIHVDPARPFKTGAEIEPSVIEGLLNSSAVGEAMYAEFIDKRRKAKENMVNLHQ
eukprot:gene6091-11476_t